MLYFATINECKQNQVDYIICSQEFAEGITGLFLNQRYNNDSFIYQKLRERFPNAKGITITVGKHGYICEKDDVVYRSARNIAGVKTTLASTLNVYDILNCDTVVVLKDAVNKIEEVYA